MESNAVLKQTWLGEYIHGFNFGPLWSKRNLTSCLVYRARKIYSPESLDKQPEYMQEFSETNGYPDKFVRKYTAKIINPEYS